MTAHAAPQRQPVGAPDAAPGQVLQRRCACGTHTGGTCAACAGEQEREEPLQRHAATPAHNPGITPAVRAVLASPGAPLPRSVRATLEPLFGTDFSRVRVHTGAAAAESAREVAADAYTVGHDVVFAHGRYAPETRAGRKLLAHELTHVVQQRTGLHARASGGPSGEAHEHQADAMGERATAPAPAPAPRFIVDDETERPAPGQLRKSDLLARLRPAVCRAADAELARVGRDTRGCPYLERAFERYAALRAAPFERALRRFAPESAGAGSAEELIPHVAARVAASVARWVETGELPTLPGGVELDALAPAGLFGSLASLAGPFSGLLGGLGRLFFKTQPGAPAPSAGGAVALAAGTPLDSGVRQQMSSAFGRALPDVRVHTGAGAAALNTRLGSRAFTLGRHIAFGQGEYQPGTPVGDALLAHELAHVVQQGTPVEPATPAEAALPSPSDAALEADADDAAAGAVVSIWGRTQRGLDELRRKTGPRLKSGLKLQMSSCAFQRLAVTPAQVSLQGQAGAPCNVAQRQDLTRVNTCCTAEMVREIEGHLAEGLPRVRNALAALQNPGDADGPLRDNFGVSASDTSRVATIRSRFQRILDLMTGREVNFVCRSRQTEGFCQPRGNVQTLASAANCARGTSLLIQYCGDYDAAVRGGAYFPPLPAPNTWPKNIIHEYAHLAGARECAMLPAGSEFYRHHPGHTYPPPNPDDAIRNADSYGWFAMDVSAEYRAPAAAEPGAAERAQVLYRNALQVLSSGSNTNPTLNTILSRGRVGQRVPRAYVADAYAPGRPGATFLFDLEISADTAQLAAGAAAQFANDPATQTEFNQSDPAHPVITRLLKIVFRVPPGESPAHLLAEALRHEGTHMLLAIDRSFGSFQQEPAIARAMTGAERTFQRYQSAAAGSARHATLVSELTAEIGAVATGTPAEHEAKAREVIEQLLEERFAVDEQARQFPRVVSNATLAGAYLFEYLAASVLGQGRTWPTRPTRQRLIDLTTALLDDTTRALSQAPATPSPTTPTAPTPPATPTPTTPPAGGNP